MKETLKNQSKKPKVTNYDEFDYDYSTFWNNREYENKAEKNVLKKILKKRHGDWFIDIGGSYGRNVDLYRKKFHNAVLMDYSVKALKQARENFKQRGITNIELVAANAYNLPFKPESFDAGMMIRVIHHIEKPKTVFKEISSIFTDDGIFILEFPNKTHIKAIFKALFTLNFELIFSKKPYLQPSKGANEGTNGKAEGIIYNYHPRFVSRKLKRNDFRIKRRFSLSFFRIPFIKKVLPIKVLMFFEKIFQAIFFWTQITPSIIYLTKKDHSANSSKNQDSNSDNQLQFKANEILDILCCPKCKGELEYKGTKLHCSGCNLDFDTKGRIYDLRYPIPND